MFCRHVPAIVLFIMLVFSVNVLSGCAEPTSSLAVPSSSAPAATPLTHNTNSATLFEKARQDIQDASKLVVSGFNKPAITISASDSRVSSIQKYLSEAVLKGMTLKTRTMVENGVTSTVSVTIPYPYGYFLTFELKDGSEIRFNCATDNIWFETDEAIYQATFSSDFHAFLDNLIGQSITTAS